ncbi:4-alpha-glucanotransferase [Clostridium vincentii]|uniref:4-alpha-glucanotransferase n=1 Tax=Clostridium vincentii TaxID=52704 RepID=A0A2T0BE75_9CLOT|nr:4-alpha-glucanotransferase [Clostridium vincentii]PRR82169.1 4-alpha-glucanotransferase [Clostridium vincentii]
MRKSGIILPIFSLPSNYGIGTFGKEAYKFVDFLEKAKETFWQILPIGPTSYGDSPYQSFSTFAGNPYFIDLEVLSEGGLLEKSQIEKFNFGNDENNIDYGIMYESRYKVLKIAFKNKNESYEKKLKEFKDLNKYWIFDYALFMAIKDYNNGVSWNNWDKDIKFRKPEAMKKYSDLLKEEIEFHVFLQFLFYKQWIELKNYANKKGVKIIGDIPIYVAEDSSDIWANTRLFMLDDELFPKKVSGCPPDLFSATGQLWGNPIYNWKQLNKEGYNWWIKRVKASLELFDVIRIDHFRGFESYWTIPYGDKTAVNGQWEKGPGIEVFDAIKKELGEIDVIAEDLGYITKEVRELLNKCNYSGMKVMQFAFDPKGDSEYLPHNYDKNTVVYTGTHDNDTIKGWFSALSKEEKEFCKKYTGMKNKDDNWTFIKSAISSVADTAIIQMQDVLNSGEEARINLPSTIGTNWKWRMNKYDMSDELANKLKDINETYRRYTKRSGLNEKEQINKFDTK